MAANGQGAPSLAAPPAGTRFFVVEPEMSGTPVRSESRFTRSIVFDGWLGDDLVRAYPAVLVTGGLRSALQALPCATGFRLSRARVESSPFLSRQEPGRRLPPFWSVDVHGEPGQDDMGITGAGALVVSRRVLDVLVEFRVGRAVFAQYSANAQAPAQPAARVSTRPRLALAALLTGLGALARSCVR
jgi:hypothetical protein